MKSYYLRAVVFILFVLIAASDAYAQSTSSREYHIKAAFLYNFIKFVDWPNEEKADSNEPITIGIISCEDFIEAFAFIKGKKIKNRSISIKYFAGYEKLKRVEDDERQWNKKMEALKTCQVLMFCRRQSVQIRNTDQILKALSEVPILTVGESEDFLKSGGIINFVEEDEKVRFEINNAAAKKAGIEIRSKLLRLAKKVIDDQSSNGAKN